MDVRFLACPAHNDVYQALLESIKTNPRYNMCCQYIAKPRMSEIY